MDVHRIAVKKDYEKRRESLSMTEVLALETTPPLPIAPASNNRKVTRHFTMTEIRRHCTPESCWITVGNDVFDVTKYLKKHPGGMEIILEYGGSDATNAFISKGHSIKAFEELEQYCIGTLSDNERIYKLDRIRSF